MTTQPLQCDDIQPWLAANALGEADDDPAARAHLMDCPKCQGDLREYRSVAGLLPYGVAEAIPPAKVRERLIAAVGAAAGRPLRRSHGPNQDCRGYGRPGQSSRALVGQLWGLRCCR